MGRRTKRQKEIMEEWYGHTGWEFMGPDKGEKFYYALQRNKSWLEIHTNDSMRIGDDIPKPEKPHD